MPHAVPPAAAAAIAVTLILITSPVRAQGEMRAPRAVRPTLTPPSASLADPARRLGDRSQAGRAVFNTSSQ
jgi:hypothetical protein